MTAFLSEAAVKAEALYRSSIVLHAFATELFGVERELFSKESE
jgi:hypothetical protein